eukprot:GEMP01012493.1.p1 GENE.GEMP01012493.1~~GEMP01012493.1.p1  ORF type:complete len:670 (+),score=130.74 GEMP01012493.1:646-2655(+)
MPHVESSPKPAMPTPLGSCSSPNSSPASSRSPAPSPGRRRRRQKSKSSIMEYPMWIVKLSDALTFTTLEPHQVLKRKGLLSKYSKDHPEPVIFISHQWLAATHPDPQFEQFRVFQQAMRNLMSGSVDTRSCWCASMILKRDVVESNWPKILQNACIWFDYFSVPQILGESQTSSGVGSCMKTEMDNLAKAVRSIPAYVELSAEMFVLCPSLQHHDFNQEDGSKMVCDYPSWVSRGWCVLERVTHFFRPNPRPVLIIRSGEYMYFQDERDGAYRRVGAANFSCCSMNHLIQTGGEPILIVCDKVKVRSVIASLLKRRIKAEAELLDESDPSSLHLLNYRYLRALRPFYLSDLPSPDKHDREAKKENSLDRFLHMYKFKTVWDNDDGWTPLRCAALSGDPDMCREILQRDVDVEAPLARSNARWNMLKGMNIIMHAAFVCREGCEEVLDLLISYGAMLDRDGLDLFVVTAMMPTPKNHINRGMQWTLQKYPTWNVNVTSNALHGLFPLLAGLLRADNENTVRLLRSHGAQIDKVHKVTNHNAFTTACSSLVLSSPSTPSILYNFTKDTCDVNRRLRIAMVTYVAVLMKMKFQKEPSTWTRTLHTWQGATPLFLAAMEGKETLVSWLLENKANPALSNRNGDTPLTIAKKRGFLHVVEVLQHQSAVCKMGDG